jgi:RHS repeat-associated protein
MHPSSAAGYPGAIQGEFCVDQNGNAVYTVAVQVPPGTADLAPSLSFVYHSAVSNGMLGAGWVLQGLSSILRTGKNPAQDGVPVKQGVRYNADDRLILDGQRLVGVEGAYGSPSAVYQTEVQTWRKVTAQGDGFVSLSGGGTRHEYGLTGDSLIRTGGTGSAIRAWALSRVADACGNYMTFGYKRDPQTAAYYPERISYTGNEGLTPARSVDFVYEARPDVQPRYEGGVKVHETQRLKQVKTFVAGRPALTYTLEYQTGKASGRSQLKQITLSDADGKSLPPTRFDWLDMDNPMFGAGKPLLNPEVKAGVEVIPLDVDGTGRRDLLTAGSNDRSQLALTLMIARGDGGFDAPLKQTIEGLIYSPGCIMPLDVDGDGATELVHVGQSNNNLQLTLVRAAQSGGQWKFEVGARGAAGPTNLRAGGRVVPLDINGDGRIDLAYCRSDDAGKLRIQVLLSTGSGFEAADATETGLPFGQGYQVVAADFNGDGLTDLLYAHAVTRDGGRYLALRVLLSNGRKLELQGGDPLPASANMPFGGALIPARLSDGDQDDLVYGYQDSKQNLSLRALFGTGKGYELASDRGMETGIRYTGLLMPMAMRGAGLTELAVAGRSDAGKLSLHMLRWNGTSFTAPEVCIQAEDRERPAGRMTFPSDIAGSGKTDLLHVTANNAGNLELALLPAPPVIPDRILRITDGLNAKYEINYRPLTDSSVYSKDDLSTKGLLDGRSIINASIGGAAWPLQATGNLSTSSTGASYALPTRQFAEYVVASYTVSDGRNHVYRREYRYRGCRVDPAGRGWLGFSSREAADIDGGTTKTEHFSQTFPAVSAVTETTVKRTSDNAFLSRERFTYQAKAEKGVYVNQLTKINGERFTAGKANPDYVETETRAFDAFGNVTLASVERSHGLPRYILSQFANNAAGWRLGDLTSRTTAADAAGNKVLSKEQFDVDPRTRKPAATRSWDDRHSRWLEVKRSYDRYGNEVSVTDHTGATSTSEYDATHHTFLVRSTLPPTGGAALSSQSDFDARFGEKIVEIDANGVRHEQTLDGLGRVIQVKGPDPQNRLVTMLDNRWGVDAEGYYAEQRKRIEWSDDSWHWSRRYVDGLGREYRLSAMSADGQGEIVTENWFDSTGNVTRESLPRFANESPEWIERTYDHSGRLIRTVEPADTGSHVVEIAYPSVNHEIVTESATGSGEAPRVSEREFAFFGDQRHITKSIDASKAVSLFEYDAMGRITKAIDPGKVSTTSVYDTLGRRIEMRVANDAKTFASEKVVHDDFLRKVKVTTNKGNVIVLEHDARQRLTRRTVTPSDGPASVTLYEHDQAEGVTVSFTKDRLARVKMAEGITYEYSYDPKGNVIAEDVKIADKSYKIQRTYSPEGGVALLIYPDGATLHNTYTKSGQLASVALTEAGARTEVASFSKIDARGRAAEIRYGNGLREQHTYNPLGQLKSQALGKDGSAPLAHTEFRWNGFHSLSRIVDRTNNRRTQSFAYDGAGRLTQAVRNADGPQTQWEVRNFTYDEGGNLKSKNGIEYIYQGHEVVEGKKDGLQVFSASYDADGVMENVERGTKWDRYESDGLGRITSSCGAKFVYDHEGKRVVKKSKDVTTYYISPEFEVTVFPNGATQTTKYARGSSGPIAQITHRTSGELLQAPVIAGVPTSGISYFHTNLVNSTSVQTNSNGEVSTTVEYEPFGEISSLTGSDNFRAKFSGKELDHETGLYYFESRYYDPTLGRFISSDDRLGAGFGEPDAQNRYAYVLNNPINRIDPSGHLSGWALFGSIVMVVAAVAFIAASTVVTGGAATALLGVLASSMLSAGVSGIMYTATAGDNFSWRDWAFEVGVGAASGAVTGAFSGVGGVAAKQMATSAARWAAASAAKQLAVKMAQATIMTAFGAVGGGVAGVTSNAMRHRDKGESGDTGWVGAFTRGMAIGTATGFASGLGQAWVKPAFKVWAAGQQYTTSTFMALGAAIPAVGAGIIGLSMIPAPRQTAAGPPPNSPPRPQPAPQAPMRFTSLGYAKPSYGYAMA